MEALDTLAAQTLDRIGDEAAPWCDAIPGFYDELVERWELEVGEPLEGAAAFIAPATRRGKPVVLRITYPDGWFTDEIVALQAWNGAGAVKVLEHDERGAVLEELIDPGTPLAEDEDETRALRRAAEVLRQLWIPAPEGIGTVANEVRTWAGTMVPRHHQLGRPFDTRLIHDAAEVLRTYGPTQKDKILLHGDFSLGNVLDAGDRAVAVDPKPLVGEREFDVTALIRDKQHELVAEPVEGKHRVQYRFDLLSELLGCNKTRLKGWALAITVDYALWSAEVGDSAWAHDQMRVARMIRDITV